MAEERESGPMPPYISYSTFVTLLDWLKDMSVVPHEWDRSLWSAKFSGGLGGQLGPGLRFLGLLNGNKIAPELEQLSLADNDERKRLMKELLRNVYGNDFVDNLARRTPKNLDDHLRELGATDATLRKAASFFINAAKAVGVQVPANIAKKARNRPAGNGRRTTTKDRKDEHEEGPQTMRPGAKSVSDNSTGTELVLDGLNPLIAVLVRDLAKKAPEWTKQQRDAWLKIFENNLDYAYPTAEVDRSEG